VTVCLSAPAGVKACAAQLVLPDETLLPVQIFRRFSARRRGVSHIALLDLRGLLTGETPATGVARAPTIRRILLVEDHFETAEAMQEVLERNGYRVLSVDSSRQQHT
jgi:hypothetical protein